MISGMINRTPYDLRWRMFGTDIRVHPLFWVMAAFISWDLNQIGLQWMLLGIAAIFVSILLHEFGHVFVSRWFGVEREIVLWAMGGLAQAAYTERKRWQRILVLAAGPGIQLLLWLGLRLLLPHIPLPENIATARGTLSVYLFLMFINFYWPILNLLPIWPLDGGQISREAFTHYSRDNGVRLSIHLSMGVCALLALHAILAHTSGQGIPYLPRGIFSAVFFAMFFVTGLQELQIENARGRWHDDRWG